MKLDAQSSALKLESLTASELSMNMTMLGMPVKARFSKKQSDIIISIEVMGMKKEEKFDKLKAIEQLQKLTQWLSI